MTKKDKNINQASQQINRIINTYYDHKAIKDITKNDYIKVMIENFNNDHLKCSKFLVQKV